MADICLLFLSKEKNAIQSDSVPKSGSIFADRMSEENKTGSRTHHSFQVRIFHLLFIQEFIFVYASGLY